MTFFDGQTAVSGGLPLAGGSVSFTISSLSIGTHSITAQYSGDGAFNAGSSAPLPETVNSPKPTPVVTLVLSAGANPSVFGDALTFTASVAPASATGTVVFFDGTVAISGNLPLNSGTVSFSTALLGGGTHAITAQYSGDATFNGAVSAALTQTVNKVPTEVDLELSLGTSAFTSGTPLTFIANITPGAGSGSVVFFDGDTAISGAIPVNNGSASFTTASLAVGSHAIRAQYSGDANFSASGSQVHKVSIK